ncbi:hypothetical protein I5M32_03520 [Pedobacter sp. SD-b]|uniref:Outer membrane protein beta-barrel domain-containing protein n=1 Tax=Pedobacter segetis TaxID=2793069 RepID=A0ABS1BGN3_9SPHI|nr:hypothetical protein [Pedobacter segetis]MBK0382018.1 hypothetical protein [Pedobacter segetis]
MSLNFENNELDRLFKSKAKNEGGEPEFEEAAWADMERRLDKRKRKIAFYYLSAAALVFVVLGAGWFFAQNMGASSSTEKIYAVKKLGPNHNIKNDAIENKKIPSSEQKESLANENFNETVKAIGTKKSFARTNFLSSDNKRKEDQNLASADEKEKIFNPDLLVPENLDTVLPSRNRNETIAESIINQQDIIIKPVLKQEIALAANSKGLFKKSQPIIWSLGLSAGPEFNTAGNFQNSVGTLNTGINFSGRLDKLSLSIGANYGIKNYSASTSQYHNIKPQIAPLVKNINASCNILEVPLTLSYQLSKGKKSSFDLNAGISSYFMLKEKYVYQYTQASGYPERTININNQNQHYFKVLQLSGTYYLPLKNTMSVIGIEPYAKIPLAGVGVGAVELKSYGINLNFNYAFKKK